MQKIDLLKFTAIFILHLEQDSIVIVNIAVWTFGKEIERSDTQKLYYHSFLITKQVHD